MIYSTTFKSFFATDLISTFDTQTVIEFEDYSVKSYIFNNRLWFCVVTMKNIVHHSIQRLFFNLYFLLTLEELQFDRSDNRCYQYCTTWIPLTLIRCYLTDSNFVEI